MAFRLGDKTGTAKDETTALEKTASLKKINQNLWEWNFKIDVLSHKRKFLSGQGRKRGNVIRSLDAVIRDIEKNIPSFIGVVSDKDITRLWNAISLLTRTRQEKPKKKQKKIRYIRTPNEPAANRCITSVIIAVKRMRETALKRRLEEELPLARAFYSYKRKKWYVREQRYRYSKIWKTWVLSYRYIPYDTLWEAFRAVDHQVDTELKERNWLLGCQKLLDKIRKAEIEDKPGLKEDIDSMLNRLKRVKVEDKRLARIVLSGAKELLDYERTGQAKGYLSITEDLFAHRIKEIEQIVDKLQEGRLTKLRQEANEKKRFLREKTEKILADLQTGHCGLTRKIIEEDLIGGKGLRYLKEPDFVPFVKAIDILSETLEKKRRLRPEEIEAAKRLFLLFQDMIGISESTCEFMTEYRDEWVSLSGSLEEERKTQREIFEKKFAEYGLKYKEVAESPQIYWTAFWQAANLSPKIGKPGEREDNPEFLRLADAIMLTRAKKFNIRPEGLALLLRLEYAGEGPALLIIPAYFFFFRQVDLAVEGAA